MQLLTLLKIILLINLFNFKVKMTGQTGDDRTENGGIMVLLKYRSNFWRTLEMLFN